MRVLIGMALVFIAASLLTASVVSVGAEKAFTIRLRVPPFRNIGGRSIHASRIGCSWEDRYLLTFSLRDGRKSPKWFRKCLSTATVGREEL